jgi:hypothetical protein
MSFSREQFQRYALVTIVVLLAALASNRLMGMTIPTFAHDRCERVRVHTMGPFAMNVEVPDFEIPNVDVELAGIEAEVQAELAAELAAEARQMEEEARQMAEEHHRMAEERCRIERERAAERVVAVR